MKLQALNKNRFLGPLCTRRHEYGLTGGSVRYLGCKTCCACNALSVIRSKKRHKKYRDKHKEEMKKYQKIYREAGRPYETLGLHD
jgi:hypothetical protein